MIKLKNIPLVIMLIIFPIVAIFGITDRLMFHSIPLATWLLAITFYVLTGLSITAGYHRLFAHRSYKAKPVIKFLLLFFGAAAFQGSALEWCRDHRKHHQFVDTPNDPYNIKQGFFYAHIGWLFLRTDQSLPMDNVKDLLADPLLRLQDKFYLLWAILTGLLFPVLIASLWGDAIGGFIVAGLIRMIAAQHTTFFINSIAHYFGSQPHSKKNSARNNWVLSLLTFGEGFHNYHHTYPEDYRNGIRFYHWDPTKWLIKTLSYFGLTESLRVAREMDNKNV